MTTMPNAGPSIGDPWIAAAPLVPTAPRCLKSLAVAPPPCPVTPPTPDPAIHPEPDMAANTS